MITCRIKSLARTQRSLKQCQSEFGELRPSSARYCSLGQVNVSDKYAIASSGSTYVLPAVAALISAMTLLIGGASHGVIGLIDVQTCSLIPFQNPTYIY